jgi:hypothetical protein
VIFAVALRSDIGPAAIPAERDAGRPVRSDNGVVSRVGSWNGRRADRAWALAASPRSVAVLGPSLAVLGLVEV